MPLKTLGCRTLAALTFGAVTLHGVDVCGGLRTFAPVTFGASNFGALTLRGTCQAPPSPPPVIVGGGGDVQKRHKAQKMALRAVHDKVSVAPQMQVLLPIVLPTIGLSEDDILLDVIMTFVLEMDS